jgi:uncharacterized protein (TIGR01777 family)
MRTIILGGSGLIGTELCKELTGAGHQVTVISRSPEKVRVPNGVDVAGWNGRDAEGWGRLVNGADAIVNLAGIGAGRWNAERKRQMIDSREHAGAAVVEAVRRAARKPGVVFQISGVGYYGVSDDLPIDENSPAGMDFLANVAEKWEESTRAVEAMGVRRVVARTGVVLASRGGVLERMMLPFRLFAGGPLGSGREWISWIHMADQVRGVRFLLEEQRAAGIFNLTSPNPLTNADFGKTLARVMRRPYWFPVPAFALRLVLGEMSTLVLDGQRVVPQRLVQMGFQFLYPDLSPALRNLLDGYKIPG